MTWRAGMRIRIRRQRMPHAESYWQEFEYDGPADNTVAGVLDYLNYRDDITDAQGNHVPRISWECSCLQAVCGSFRICLFGIPHSDLVYDMGHMCHLLCQALCHGNVVIIL